MIEGLTSLFAKRISTPALGVALRRGDNAVTQEIVNQLLNSPEFLFDEYVNNNQLDQVIASAPLCTTTTIGLGLHAAIIRVPVNPHMLRAIVPYTELHTRQYALQLACERNCDIAIDILYPLCDIPSVVDRLSHANYQRERCLFWATALQQRMSDEKLRETLHKELCCTNQAPQRKM